MKDHRKQFEEKMSSKKAWKLHEFPAHAAHVNAASLGHKSGRVLVTGGGDKKVNLWAVGKPNCIMSLSGHSTPISCVQFSTTEEHVCAGSHAGALKIWDLESAKIMRTLTGHRSTIACVDFHPYGDFLASGSCDSGIKMWDMRRKGCIFGYKGHNSTVNSLKFSPDGQWIASGGDDKFVKVWDIRVGKILTQFSEHTDSVTSVEFHPHEFLLVSGSNDRTVKFFDLETFSLVSSSNCDVAPVKCVYFHPDGSCLFSASSETLRVHSWEPSEILNSVPTSWTKIQDIAVTQQQLVGVTIQLTNVSVYVVDIRQLNKTQHGDNAVPISSGHLRRIFSTERSSEFVNSLNAMTTNEESESEKEGEDDQPIPHAILFNSRQAFQAHRDLSRTPPPEDELRVLSVDDRPVSLPRISGPPSPNEEPRKLAKFKYVSVRSEPSNSQPSNPRQQEWSPRRSSVPAFSQGLCSSQSSHAFPSYSPENNSSHPSSFSDESSGPTSTRSSDDSRYFDNSSKLKPNEVNDQSVIKHSPSEPILRRQEHQEVAELHSAVPLQHLPRSPERPVAQCQVKPMLKSTNLTSEFGSSRVTRSLDVRMDDDFVPIPLDKPMGLSIEDFLPRHNQLAFGNGVHNLDMDESNILSSLFREHQKIIAVLLARHRNLRIVYNIWQSKDVKTALEAAVDLRDSTVVVDLLCVLVLKPSIWNLDVCVIVLPSIFQLLQSKYEAHMVAGCNALRLILKNFIRVIKTNIDSPIQTVGVDISREERYNKSLECYRQLVEIRTFTLKRQTLQGKIGHSFREIHSLLSGLD